VILNILIVTTIKKASAVVFTLGGIVKDIGVIVASLVIFRTAITRLEVPALRVRLLASCRVVSRHCP
jgi:hypothetical protein